MPREAYCHYDKYVLVALDNREPFVEMELQFSDVLDDFEGGLEIFCTEENPTEYYEMERQDNADEPRELIFWQLDVVLKETLYNQSQTVENTPDDEFPRSSMPQSSEKHR